MATPRQTLTVQLMHATARIAELEAQLAQRQPAVTRPPRELPAHFVAAREAAIRMGRSVQVGPQCY